MKYLIIKKLNNVALQMIERLFEKAKEFELDKKDLFVLTLKFKIEARLRSYILGIKIGENVSIKDFVKETQGIISSLVIVKEEPYFV